MSERLRLTEREIDFYKPLIALYLKYGSVDQVFASKYHNTGVSYPHFHRVLNDWGIIKSTGPQSHFTEAIFFLTTLAMERLPLESLYRTMPPSLQISAATLHRILSYIKRGLTRRHGTALLVSPESDPNSILIGRDISTPRPELGKPYGSLSLPMTYAKRTESGKESVLRTLQQEVAASLTVNRYLSPKIIPDNPKVLLTINIADVRVKVYKVIVPDTLIPQLDSFKLSDLNLVPIEQVAASVDLDSHYRAGVSEIASGFLETRAIQPPFTPHFGSLLNQSLATLPTIG
ncbi:hypothetical protein A3A84_01945 [Candidatus Collierbacteria bacterium RIFCSPLOWO2_01_FULL_50_23]|uniref:Uncharacterized protein n=1 Tax=Candidatus Collierbacteria bacterium RIFCSPHIGHO2_01_FULL_50_25 TaxID=1817722 RepID=A0A1F5EYF7_9BACT|nr:MAG: hypothetical protein A2703_01610 [Candidatus Collierbacteria bacterium RIFCSPHIGHO2_01_FULL_50_25]OGD73729.1 MAG: hypothetical protein A3A84_01945 [Candidatus Collierbacteria bacterium RIFCSPLOWO2_01_FULL_50_23]